MTRKLEVMETFARDIRLELINAENRLASKKAGTSSSHKEQGSDSVATGSSTSYIEQQPSSLAVSENVATATEVKKKFIIIYCSPFTIYCYYYKNSIYTYRIYI